MWDVQWGSAWDVCASAGQRFTQAERRQTLTEPDPPWRDVCTAKTEVSQMTAKFGVKTEDGNVTAPQGTRHCKQQDKYPDAAAKAVDQPNIKSEYKFGRA